MFKKKIAALFLLTLIVFISAASQIHAQEPKTVKIDAKVQFVDTGIKIDAGDIIEVVDITGQAWVSGKGGGPGGKKYAGTEKPSTSNGQYFLYPNATEHTIVAFVDKKDYRTNAYQVRKNIYTQASNAGNLFFAFNDGYDHYGDNSGEFNVTYRIIKKAKVCSETTGKRLPIKWINKTGMPVRVNWINFDCKEETSASLIQPNGVFSGETEVDHIFRVRSEKGADIGLIRVESNSQNVDINLEKN